MAQKQVDYLLYLLCLWRENGGKGLQNGATRAVWRASLETLSGKSHGFANLDDLVSFLHRQVGERPDVEPGCSPLE